MKKRSKAAFMFKGDTEKEATTIHIRCVVKRKIFFSPVSGYSVFAAIPEGRKDEIRVTGTSFEVSEGVLLDVEGAWKRHEKYGQSFDAVSWLEVRPETLIGIEKYLSSGKIKGIGKRFAKAIVEKFGDRTFEIIEYFPERLIAIPRLGQERAYRASRFLKEQSLERDVTVFLSSFGISPVFAKRIIKAFGHAAVATVRQNPYCLIESIDGISFKSADKIAKAMGYEDDDPRRLQAGVVFVMSELIHQGDCYIMHEQLLKSAEAILNAGTDKIEYAVQSNFKSGKFVNDMEKVYLREYYDAECYCARQLVDILRGWPSFRDDGEDNESMASASISHIEQQEHMRYDAVQKSAIHQALKNRIMILTGGPGTGKTTVLKGIICALEMKQYTIAVCAPTGRAAKRAKESTSKEATTIHRLLSYSWEKCGFRYDESNNLDEDVIVVDEFSMVDLMLFKSLLEALNPSKRLIIVGDVDQLPSVGAGNVLSDLINSGVVPVVRLTTIHRQEQSSRIPFVAREIKEGRMPHIDNRGSKDFFFIENTTEQCVCEDIVNLVCQRLPKAYNLNSDAIQVLCPQRTRVSSSCNSLNKMLQERLNPQGEALQYGGLYFRKGDRVMQTRNNYAKGVFNGDIGIIQNVDEEMGFLKVLYPEAAVTVRYEEGDLDELDLAYATTIHKSQGSEYNTVIVPVLKTAYLMLQRNLIYTAVTRAKERCIIIGDKQALYAACTNMYLKNRRLFVERQTYLKERIREAQMYQ